DDKMIDKNLQRIASSNRTTKPVEGERASKKGDVAIITFHGRTKDDGVQHEGMHAHGVELELGSGRFIPGFEEQIIGKKAGESFEVNASFRADSGATELDARHENFDTVLVSINE